MSPISVAKAKKPNPERMFFDREPETWEDLEGLIQQAFDEMGYESIRGHKVKTVRGKVKVDVFARKVSTPIPTIVLIWNDRRQASVNRTDAPRRPSKLPRIQGDG